MAAPAWATDLTDIYVGGAGSFTAVGGGPAGLNTETDYFIQGTDCKSKNAWVNDFRGMLHDFAADIPLTTDLVVVVWGYYSAVNALDTKASGGFRIVAGSSASDFWHFFVGGSDTLVFDSWVPYVVNFDLTADATNGTPTGDIDWLGVIADLPTSAGPTKGAPLACDAMRYGRHRIEYTNGEVADFNTFAKAEAYANDVTRRWGNIELDKGVYRIQGFHSFGASGAAVNMQDSDVVLFIRPAEFTSTAYNRFEVINSLSTVEWTNIIMQSLNTVSKGSFIVTDGIVTFQSCQFIDMATFDFIGSSIVENCVFKRCEAITTPGTSMIGTKVLESEVATNTSALIWDVGKDPDTDLVGMEFTIGAAAHHAIELGTTVPLEVTLRDITFTGFNTSDAQDDSVVHVLRTSGDVTINAVNCVGTVSFKSAGANVTVVVDPVDTTITVRDANTGSLIPVARVLVTASDGTGPMPFEKTCTITRTGSTATASSGSHGLIAGEKVLVKGADQREYNGVFVITQANVNTFKYIVTGTPDTPATGTIVCTGVVIDGDTSSGVITDNRTHASDQPITGRARKSSTAPFYITGGISGIVDSVAGFSATIFLFPDE